MVPKRCVVTFNPGQAVKERVESTSRTATAGRKPQSKAESSLEKDMASKSSSNG
jgi:nucleoid DNA-binding protein